MRQELCDGLAGVHWVGKAGSAGDAGEEEEEAAGGDGARPPLRRAVTSREQGNDGATRPRLTTDAGDSDMDSSCHNATAKMLATAPARGNVMNASKPLAFSIERIMARTPEPKALPVPHFLQGTVPKGDPKHSLHLNSSIPCMIPFVPVAYDTNPKAGMTGSEPRKASLETPGAPAATPAAPAFSCSDLLNCALSLKSDLARDALPLQQYRLVRPRVVNHSSFHAMGALCYLNRGDGPCHPAAGVNIHPVASYFLSSPLHPQPKTYLAERNKLVVPSVEKYPSGVAFKDLSQAQLQHYMKESAQLLSEKIAFKTSDFSRGSPNTKPKVFTCEVCGKASTWGEGWRGQGAVSPPSFLLNLFCNYLYTLVRMLSPPSLSSTRGCSPRAVWANLLYLCLILRSLTRTIT